MEMKWAATKIPFTDSIDQNKLEFFNRDMSIDMWGFPRKREMMIYLLFRRQCRRVDQQKFFFVVMERYTTSVDYNFDDFLISPHARVTAKMKLEWNCQLLNVRGFTRLGRRKFHIKWKIEMIHNLLTFWISIRQTNWRGRDKSTLVGKWNFMA